jgi:protein-disulfide reductase (glutathione)
VAGRSHRIRSFVEVVAAATLVAGCIEMPRGAQERAAEREAGREPAAASPATAPSHGFGDGIAWRELDEGLGALARGEPMMLVVHASWCARCKELKPLFSRGEIAELSRKFVMVNVDQDEAPKVLGYAPDGSYIPRVLFFDPSTGAVDPEIKNPRRSRHLYYYGPRDDLAASMRRAIDRHEPT